MNVYTKYINNTIVFIFITIEHIWLWTKSNNILKKFIFNTKDIISQLPDFWRMWMDYSDTYMSECVQTGSKHYFYFLILSSKFYLGSWLPK